eukprot:TRINITY_DN5942_c0_g1_i12.p1 TRINITY_DN5942_c0_g1~~TRINITY_DN5942_c0_g1_i12.p1  ORF type:complete len:442 (-),score=37.07 TRINITY_DN5942_c0_g1_i12:97-1422(-)
MQPLYNNNFFNYKIYPPIHHFLNRQKGSLILSCFNSRSIIRLLFVFSLILISLRQIVVQFSIVEHIEHFGHRTDSSDERTLVLYVHANVDNYHQYNFKYFLNNGIVNPNQSVDYVFILQGGWGQAVGDEISPIAKRLQLQENVLFVEHKNECFDWGTVGWYIRKIKKAIKQYQFVILMNSSARGPFLPWYMQEMHYMSWVEIMQQGITKQVKFYGPTISCEVVYLPTVSKVTKYNPHVQSYAIIMDQKGLEIILNDQRVFKCYKELWQVIYFGELGASQAIIRAGCNIGSFQKRYKNVDFRKRRNWRCNNGKNPTVKMNYDGLDLNPLEAMFIKVKDTELYQWRTDEALKYSAWYKNQVEQLPEQIIENTQNRTVDEEEGAKQVQGYVEKLFSDRKHCWDAVYYQVNNPDLQDVGLQNLKDLWQHFLRDGYIQDRPFKLVC